MTLKAPKGTDDVLPPASRRWRRLLRTWEDLAEVHGYDLVMTPIFEATEVFARGVGEATEVVEKQMYTFTDKGDRSLTLRPENTAGVVRAYIESGRQGVFKGAYSGPMFRYERPQQGRRRQFWQMGVEYLGEPAVAADLEVIEVGYRFLTTSGLDDVVVELNSIGDAPDRIAYMDVLRTYLDSKRSDLSEDAARRIESNPLRVLDSKADAELLTDAPAPADHLGPESADHFDALRHGLDAAGIPYRIAPRLVRGLDYYNRTVFEYIPTGYGAAQNAVGGGGRYDGLARLLGGNDVPGVGLALGFDRILVALGDADDDPSLDAYLIVTDPGRRAEANGLLRVLRSHGVRADITASDRSVKAQFKAADRRGSRFAVVVGDEFDDGTVSLKHLATGDETSVPVAALTDQLKAGQ